MFSYITIFTKEWWDLENQGKESSSIHTKKSKDKIKGQQDKLCLWFTLNIISRNVM